MIYNYFLINYSINYLTYIYYFNKNNSIISKIRLKLYYKNNLLYSYLL